MHLEMDMSEKKRYLLSIKKLCLKLDVSKSFIYSRLNSHSKYYDEKFPKPIRLSENSVAWIEDQIDDWIESKMSVAQ